jgi:hypothetical protein
MLRRTAAIALVVTQAALALTGCVSVKATGTQPVPRLGGGVSVRVFADDGARAAQKTGPAGVLGELERRENDRWVAVFRSLDPAWAVAGVPAGRYRLRVPARLDRAGAVVRIDARTVELDVQDGQVTEAEIVLKRLDTGTLAVGAVAVATAAATMHPWHSDSQGRPRPLDERLEAMPRLSIGLRPLPGGSGAEDLVPPMVTSHFPEAGGLMVARRPRVVLALSEPLQVGELEADGVTVQAEKGGPIPGVSSYDPDRWWVVWRPQGDLPAGETIRVTLAADVVEDLHGNAMRSAVSFTFLTAL